MPANTSPLFVLTPNSHSVQNNGAACTSRTTASNTAIIVTGAANGTRVEGIIFQATGTTTAASIFIWHYNSATTAYSLIGEVLVAAITPSNTAIAWTGSWTPSVAPLVLMSGDAINFSCTIAQTHTAIPIAGDY